MYRDPLARGSLLRFSRPTGESALAHQTQSVCATDLSLSVAKPRTKRSIGQSTPNTNESHPDNENLGGLAIPGPLAHRNGTLSSTSDDSRTGPRQRWGREREPIGVPKETIPLEHAHPATTRHRDLEGCPREVPRLLIDRECSSAERLAAMGNFVLCSQRPRLPKLHSSRLTEMRPGRRMSTGDQSSSSS